MISGVTSDEKSLKGVITNNGSLKGKISVSVKDVPYYETNNPYGGVTVYIGKEIVDNGN